MFDLWQYHGADSVANGEVFEADRSYVFRVLKPMEHVRLQRVETDQTDFVDSQRS